MASSEEVPLEYGINPHLAISNPNAVGFDAFQLPEKLILLVIQAAAKKHIAACKNYKEQKKQSPSHRVKGFFKHKHGHFGIERSTRILEKVTQDLMKIDTAILNGKPLNSEQLIKAGITQLQNLLNTSLGSLDSQSFKVILLTEIKANFGYSLLDKVHKDYFQTCSDYYAMKSPTAAVISEQLATGKTNLSVEIANLNRLLQPALLNYVKAIEASLTFDLESEEENTEELLSINFRGETTHANR